jgi:hypothetical protein
MSYRLKTGQQDFEMVDGPFEGRKYVRGAVYDTVPPGEEWRFDGIDADMAPAGPEQKPGDVVAMPTRRARTRAIDDQPA